MMRTHDNLYSRVIAWLKILLPLAALAILSTVFLISRETDAPEGIPFAEFDIEQRARDQGVTAPSFAGATDEGDLVSFTAASARPDPANANRALARDIAARIQLTGGTVLRFSASEGTLDQPSDTARLTGGVVLTSSTGYKVLTNDLVSGISHIHAESAGAIRATGPPGRFSAGRMVLSGDNDTGHVQLVFTEGVKLIYDPSENKD